MTRLASRVTDPSVCAPHGTDGPATTGSPNVYINNLCALRIEDTGTYPSSCDSTFTQIKELIVGGGKVWRAVEGAQTVLVNQRELVAEGDGTLHSHGPGKMKRIGVDVYVGGPTLNVLEQSRQDAIESVDDALASIDRWNEEDRRRFKEWFGDDSEEARQAMRENLLKIRDRLHTMEILGDDGTNFAYVYSNDSSKVYVEDAYWKAPRTGENSKAGTMVHEASHYRDTARSGDHAYGTDAAKKLAQTDPKSAQNNADNIEYFTETAPKSNHELLPPKPTNIA
jgi:lysine-specific metallo-endopeptidase family protein